MLEYIKNLPKSKVPLEGGFEKLQGWDKQKHNSTYIGSVCPTPAIFEKPLPLGEIAKENIILRDFLFSGKKKAEEPGLL